MKQICESNCHGLIKTLSENVFVLFILSVQKNPFTVVWKMCVWEKEICPLMVNPISVFCEEKVT